MANFQLMIFHAYKKRTNKRGEQKIVAICYDDKKCVCDDNNHHLWGFVGKKK